MDNTKIFNVGNHMVIWSVKARQLRVGAKVIPVGTSQLKTSPVIHFRLIDEEREGEALGLETSSQMLLIQQHPLPFPLTIATQKMLAF